jgi:predicted nucleic acid-binding protein
LDTAVWIYSLESHPQFGQAARAVLRHVEGGAVGGVASTLVLAELLVLPFAAAGEVR